MNGLLDIWGDYWKRKEPQEDGTFGSSTDFSKRQVNRFNRSNLNTAGGVNNSGASADMDKRIPRKRGEIPTPPKYIRQQKEVRDRLGRVVKQGSPINSPNTVGHPMRNKTLPVIPGQDASKTPFHPSQGDLKYHGGDQQDQLNWWQKLAGKMGIDFDKAAANWKDKGGFEGLMANPAFTMGLAFMQAGAEGKTLGQGSLDNVMKAAGISSHYKRLMEAKAGGVTEVTTGQMDQIKSILGTKGISAPILRKMLPGNQSEMYEQAVEDIAFKVQKKVNKMKKDAKASGKDIEVGSRLYKKIIDQMIASGEIDKKGGLNIGGYQVIDETLETKARGGPVTKGKAYVVGEEGPEVIIPHSSGNVLSTDDSQIFAMLLAANPQLQKVSKARAEKIMRARFPEYFE